MRGEDFIEYVRKRLGTRLGRKATDSDVALIMGKISLTALYNWKNTQIITPRQMSGLLLRAADKAVESAESLAIKTIVEFPPIRKAKTAGGRKFEVFSRYNDPGNINKYLDGLFSELNSSSGIYIFHDSRGRALYVGSTHNQTLWLELNQAFNRYREVQKIRRVKHPSINVEFKTNEEKRRQIYERTVVLHEVAGFVSAYRVTKGLIGELESLLIRSFANDIMNKQMANLGHKAKRAKKQAT